ncbi:4-hydroxybenzoate polyprenyl transferase [Flagelloscypha sp. PMI_526]|nr:4-hydroxybenzoate polyprenyl transferase [Flagelloscypha sp. PMI_526]
MPSFIDRLPRPVRPYLNLMRLDKPVGAAFLYVPTMWSIIMASYSNHIATRDTVWYLSLFLVGSVLMRSACTTLNDMADREYDKAVERTKNRPLARGDISMTQAWAFLIAQLGFGLAILLGVHLNYNTILLGVAGLGINVIYPFMKRITYWPQLILGFAFNWGVIIGWCAVTNTVDMSVCMPLYIGGIAWTLVYDSIYAYQDKKDDVKAGIGSTALVFGERPRPILAALTVVFIALATYAGYVNGNGSWYYAGMALCAIHHARIIQRTDFDSPKSCWDGFSGSAWAGMWITLGAFLDLAL